METLLALENVTKNFGGITACKNVSLNIAPGAIIGLIGPNGAGKTTIFNLITGVYTPTGGAIRFRGQSLTGLRPDQIVRRGIARTFQNIRLFRNLSVLDNVCIAVDQRLTYPLSQALLRLPAARRRETEIHDQAAHFLAVVGLADKLHARANSLPYGLQRKLEIARALAQEPSLLLLDEPAAGMNPEESRDLAALLRAIHARFHLTTLLIEHHMDVVMSLCDHIVVLNFGEKLAQGTPEEIQANPEVLRAYLGKRYQHAGS